MDYEKMWNDMKVHYENRIKKLENKDFPNSVNPRTMSENVLEVMKYFEMMDQLK